MYQMIFQAVKIILPIITVPIISKSFGANGVGVYSYTSSIVQYFILLAALGINIYGSKTVAECKNDEFQLSQKVNEIISLKLVTTIFILICYFLTIPFFESDYKYLYIIQSLNIFAVIFDISWYFAGIEDFKKTSMTNLLTQLVAFMLIILLIKDKSDLLLYCFIQGSANILSFVGVWPSLIRNIKLRYVSLNKTKHHIPYLFTYFIPQVGVIFYTTLNKTMLGIMGTKSDVGFYTNATNLTSICVTLITTLDLVLLPRMSSLFSNNNISKMKSLFKKSLSIQLFFSIPISFGLASIADSMVPWFLGESFTGIEKVIRAISPLIIVIPIGMSLSRQILIPMGKSKIYNFSIILGSIVGIVSNILLLPLFGLRGAIISYVGAETLVCIYRIIKTRKILQININSREVLISVISSIIMSTIIFILINRYAFQSIFGTIFLILLGGIIYFLSMLLFKSKILKELLITYKIGDRK